MYCTAWPNQSQPIDWKLVKLVPTCTMVFRTLWNSESFCEAIASIVWIIEKLCLSHHYDEYLNIIHIVQLSAGRFGLRPSEWWMNSWLYFSPCRQTSTNPAWKCLLAWVGLFRRTEAQCRDKYSPGLHSALKKARKQSHGKTKSPNGDWTGIRWHISSIYS